MTMDKYLETATRLASENLASSHPEHAADPLYLVWSCKALANRKYIFGVPKAGIIFEVSYNGSSDEWYVDRYRKEENVVFAEKEPTPILYDKQGQTMASSAKPAKRAER